MTRCKGCGKKGLFLKLNARGLCMECAEKAQMAPKSGQIHLSINDVSENKENEALGHSDEIVACQFFIDKLVERGKDRSLFKIEHRASDYTSLVYDGVNDFLRVKITDNVSWISIALTNDDQKLHFDDPLFNSQKNKNQRHWRSDFNSIDQLPRYLEIAETACIPILLGTERLVTDKEKIIADYLYDSFLSCGAEPENMFFYTLAQEFELLYMCGAGNIRFKAFVKKPGGYLIIDRDYEAIKIKGEKGKYFFVELSELDCLKEKLIPLKIKRGKEMAKYYKEHYTNYVR